MKNIFSIKALSKITGISYWRLRKIDDGKKATQTEKEKIKPALKASVIRFLGSADLDCVSSFDKDSDTK